jgi:glycosyltransferase involved in cell wall biosynthesis
MNTTVLQESVSGEHVLFPGAIRPLFVVGGLYSLSSGVAWIMRDLAAALARAGSPVTICAAECRDRGLSSIGRLFEPPTRWQAAQGKWLGGLSWAPKLKPIIHESLSSADLLHNHSLWMLPNSYASRAAMRLGKPAVITAHGTLESWAIRNARWKKRIAGWMFQNKELRRADCIHVNTAAEIEGVRQFGLTAPIAVIPNGIDIAECDNRPDTPIFTDHYPELANRRILLFMARLHEKKGLGHLIPAWGRLAQQYGDWHLVIAGPDNGYRTTCERLVRELQLRHRVTITGPLHGDAKKSALSAAEAFVQPSFSEGFSMAIIEALACRLPVLLTPGCNFMEAVNRGAAIEVNPTVADTESGLRRIMSQSPSTLQDMGAAGRRLVEDKYTWDIVASQTLKMYLWLVKGGSPPDFVVTT